MTSLLLSVALKAKGVSEKALDISCGVKLLHCLWRVANVEYGHVVIHAITIRNIAYNQV